MRLLATDETELVELLRKDVGSVTLFPVDATHEQAFYQDQCGLLEPSAIIAQVFDAFTYSPPIGETHYVLGSFGTAIGGVVGRFDVRDPVSPLALHGASLQGIGSGSYAVILDPRAVIHEDPRGEYFRRLRLQRSYPLKMLPGTGSAAGNLLTPFIGGPFGTLIVGQCVQDLGVVGAGVGLSNELSQYAYDSAGAGLPPPQPPISGGAGWWIRWHSGLSLIMSKSILGAQQTFGGDTGVGSSGIAYVNLGPDWSPGAGEVSPTYLFRDTFLRQISLDPLVWTLFGVPGNVAIDPRFDCVKGIGATDYANGMCSTPAVSAPLVRNAGLHFVADVWTGGNQTQSLVGFCDGVSSDFARYQHGLLLDNSGVFTLEFQAGIGASVVCPASIPLKPGSLYRVRISPGPVRGALYELQGGYGSGPAVPTPMIGSATWYTLADTRPASVVTAPSFRVGFTPHFPDAIYGGQFLSDVRVYA